MKKSRKRQSINVRKRSNIHNRKSKELSKFKINDLVIITKKGCQKGQLAIIINIEYFKKTSRYKVEMRTGNSVGEVKSYTNTELNLINKAYKIKKKLGYEKYAEVAMDVLADDYCKGIYQHDCDGNLNILRIDMPQILDYPLGKNNLPDILKNEQASSKQKILEKMIENGYDKDTLDLLNSQSKTPFDYVVKEFKAKKTKTLVRDLIPVQKEIRKSSTRYIIDMEVHNKYMNHKTYKSSSILNGTFLTINVNNKVYILDGHHRWSAMKRIYPNEKVNTYEIKSKNVRTTIKALHKLNYVYTERITGQSFL